MKVDMELTTGTNGIIFALLRSALMGETFGLSPSETEWAEAYQMADGQSVLGVCFENRSRDGSLICFKDKTRKRKSSIAASVFSSGWRIILFRAKLSFVPSLEFLRYSV